LGVIALECLDRVATHAVIPHQRNAPCPHMQTLRTGEQWLQSVKFPYAAPRGRIQQVIDNYSRVGVGSSERQVIEAFGPPDYEQDFIPKEPWRPCVGYEFVYYFEKSDGETDNILKDRKLSKSRSRSLQMARHTELAALSLVYNIKARQYLRSPHAVRRMRNSSSGDSPATRTYAVSSPSAADR